MWDMDTGKCSHVLEGHASAVKCVYVHGFRLLSGSSDRTVRYWDTRSGECLHKFGEHNCSVDFVSLNEKMAVSAGADTSIKVWDVGPTKSLLFNFDNEWLEIKFLLFNGVSFAAFRDSSAMLHQLAFEC